MIILISFRFLYASITGRYLYDPSSKIMRLNTLDMYSSYNEVIYDVYASELAIDENGQRLYWINNANSMYGRRYILPVSF